MSDQIKIVIADDHATVRGGLKYALETDEKLSIVDEVGNGKELIVSNENYNPDVLIVDINMPEMNGIEAIKEIRKTDKEVKILVITMYQNENYIKDAFNAGVNGYLFKMSSIEEFFEAVHSVAEGKEYYGESVSKKIMNKYLGNGKKRDGAKSSEIFLTDREKEILKLIAEGLTSQEIGQKLFLSHYTIENHRKNMIQKSGLKNTTVLIKYAIENGIISI